MAINWEEERAKAKARAQKMSKGNQTRAQALVTKTLDESDYIQASAEACNVRSFNKVFPRISEKETQNAMYDRTDESAAEAYADKFVELAQAKLAKLEAKVEVAIEEQDEGSSIKEMLCAMHDDMVSFSKRLDELKV